MKVALLGNMNNNHFALVRYLRDRGIDADLLLFNNEIDHFHPACDTYSLDFMRYTRQLSWGASTSYLATSAKTVANDLRGYDVIVGCGLSPAYLNKAGMALDIFAPYGGDLWIETKYRVVAPQRLASVWSSARSQSTGIRNSRVFHMGSTNDIYEREWERYRGRSERWLEGLPMVHSPTYRPEALEEIAIRTHWGEEFKAIRAESDLMIMYHSRHLWQTGPDDANHKGTERLLRGWAELRRRRPDLRMRFVTLEYGRDVPASRKLMDELGISDTVVWMPKMYRKDLMIGVLLCDIVAAEFQHSWLMSGVMYEALVGAKPVLAHRDDSLYPGQDLYAIMNAREPDEITAMLEAYLDDRERFLAMGQAGREWYEREVSDRAVSKYESYVRGKG